MLKKIPADYFDSAKGTLKLLWEEEWRALGITQVRAVFLSGSGLKSWANIHGIYRVWDGSIMRCTSRSLTSSCSSQYRLISPGPNIVSC